MNPPPLIYSFDPIAAEDAEILILGSMPGQASLDAGQYYAHPRNAFWPIMAKLLGFDASLSYAGKIQALQAAKIALWDVLRCCARQGSADARIESERLAANDLPRFLGTHLRIKRVFFNGSMAESCYKRHVQPQIDRDLAYLRLPSTSPAHASMPFADKLEAWRAVVETQPASQRC